MYKGAKKYFLNTYNELQFNRVSKCILNYYVSVYKYRYIKTSSMRKKINVPKMCYIKLFFNEYQQVHFNHGFIFR